MRYEYGAPVTVITPAGKSVSAQLGDFNGGDPIVHVTSYMIEAPAGVLREEGWQVPEIGGHATPYEPSTTTGTSTMKPGRTQFNAVPQHELEADAARIVNNLLEVDEKPPAPKPLLQKPVGREEPERKKKHCSYCGSYAHSSDKCPLRDRAVI